MDKLEQSYDFIIIGGGATGCGIALDASLRGYSVLLLEKDDFGSGASSKSTKLVHGGVRYLEKAVLNFDKAQFRLVREALKERAIFLNNASNISKKLQIITPLYSWFQGFYLYSGLKLYQFLSIPYSLGTSTFISKKFLGFLKQKDIKGAVSYFDGSFDDNAMITSLLLTSQKYGAQLKNYCESKEFLYKNEKISGVKYFDKLLEKSFEVKAKVVINATGVDIDILRDIDTPNIEELISRSKGSHIVLPKRFLDSTNGVLIPKTKDGRVIFFHPWKDVLIVGTTEVASDKECCEKISEEEIKYLLFYANKYLKEEVKKSDIVSTFSGVRALAKNESSSLSSIVREHIISISKSGLVSISAGKWTTYRKMSEDCLESIFNNKLIEKRDICKTKENELVKLKSLDINEDDIIYAIENYFAKRVIDILLRTTTIVLRDYKSSLEKIDFVANIMAQYFSWSEDKKNNEIEFARNYIKSRFG